MSWKGCHSTVRDSSACQRPYARSSLTTAPMPRCRAQILDDIPRLCALQNRTRSTNPRTKHAYSVCIRREVAMRKLQAYRRATYHVLPPMPHCCIRIDVNAFRMHTFECAWTKQQRGDGAATLRHARCSYWSNSPPANKEPRRAAPELRCRAKTRRKAFETYIIRCANRM